MTVVVFKLNLEELERLLGPDPQVRFEVANGVIQKFAEIHLKPLANDDTYRQVEERIKIAIKHAADQAVGSIKNYEVKLNPQFLQSIESRAQIGVAEAVDKLITAAIEKQMPRIEGKVIHQLNVNLRKLVDDEVQRRLKAAAAS